MRRRFDGINVIPSIDVLLVLLAIVLTTASFLPRGRVDLELPEGGAPGRPDPRAVVLSLDRAGRLHVDGEPMAPGEAADRLRRLPPGTAVRLEADAAVPFGRFVAVLEWLDEAPRPRRRYVARVLARVRAARHYPASARRRGIEGTVWVSFRVRADGQVEALTAEGGHRLLRLAALAAVRARRPFQPRRPGSAPR